jgi:hypothetical protein
VDYRIRVADMAYFYCLLEIAGPEDAFPLVVGCSFRNADGQVQDLRHRRIAAPGYAFWHARLQSDSKRNNREVIFALYPDRAHSQRLADTGWVREYGPAPGPGMKGRVWAVGDWERRQNVNDHVYLPLT